MLSVCEVDKQGRGSLAGCEIILSFYQEIANLYFYSVLTLLFIPREPILFLQRPSTVALCADGVAQAQILFILVSEAQT